MTEQEEIQPKEVDKSLINDFLSEVFSLDHGIPGTFWMMLKNPKAVIDGYFTEKPDYVNPFRYTIFILAVTTLISTVFVDTEQLMNNAMEGVNGFDETQSLLEESIDFNWNLYFENVQRILVAIAGKFSQLLYILILAPTLAFFSRLFFKGIQSRYKKHYVMFLYQLATFSVLTLAIIPLMMNADQAPFIALLSNGILLIYIIYVQLRYLRPSGFIGFLKAAVSAIIGMTFYNIMTTILVYLGALVMTILPH